MAEQHKDDEGKRSGRRTGVHTLVGHHKQDDALITRSYKGLVDAVKKPPSRTTWLMLIAVLLAAALVGSWFYFTASATASSSDLWLKMYTLTPTAAALQSFANDSGEPNSIQARFALAAAARREMQSVAMLGSNTQRAAALTDVTKARDAYEKLVRESGDAPALMQESLMGAAKANEALGDLDKAKGFYDQLKRDYPKTALGQEADARLQALDDDAGRKAMETLSSEFASK